MCIMCCVWYMVWDLCVFVCGVVCVGCMCAVCECAYDVCAQCAMSFMWCMDSVMCLCGVCVFMYFVCCLCVHCVQFMCIVSSVF